MSFNFALAFLPHTSPAALGGSSTATISFDEASSSKRKGASATALGPHTLLVDPTMQNLDLDAFATPGATAVFLSGITDTYVISIQDETPRLRVFAQREVAEDEGVPVPAEAVFDQIENPEDAHLEFFCRVAGITVNDLWSRDWTPITQ